MPLISVFYIFTGRKTSCPKFLNYILFFDSLFPFTGKRVKIEYLMFFWRASSSKTKLGLAVAGWTRQGLGSCEVCPLRLQISLNFSALLSPVSPKSDPLCIYSSAYRFDRDAFFQIRCLATSQLGEESQSWIESGNWSVCPSSPNRVITKSNWGMLFAFWKLMNLNRSVTNRLSARILSPCYAEIFFSRNQ